MIVKAIKTHKITTDDTDLFKILDQYVTELPEKSVLAITSKIIAITQNRVVKIEESTKDELVKRESDFYIPREENKYDVYVTIKDNILVGSAGIDESNSNGHFVLWPTDTQSLANNICEYLKKRFKIENVGVVITDSHNVPLQYGSTGVSISHSGFFSINSYIDKPDLFGRIMHVSKVNVADSLANSAVFEMGEGAEQTPIAVVTDIPNVRFNSLNPSEKELLLIHLNIENDMFHKVLESAPWVKGGDK